MAALSKQGKNDWAKIIKIIVENSKFPDAIMKITVNQDDWYQIQFRLKYPYCVIATDETTKDNKAYRIVPGNWWEHFKRYTLKIKGLCFDFRFHNLEGFYPKGLHTTSYHTMIESRPYKHKYWSDHDYNIKLITEDVIHEKHIKDFINDVIKLINLPKAKI